MVNKYEEEVLETIADSENPTQTKPKSKYDDPDLITYVVTGRTQGKTFTDIAEGLKDRGYPNIGVNNVSEIFKSAVAKTTLTHNTANDKFKDFSDQLEEMYSQAIRVLKNLINTINKIYEEFEASDMETMQKYLMFIRLAPQIKLTTDQIFRAINDWKEQQDKIEKTQELTVWKPDQMMDYIIEWQPRLLKQYEEEGKIVIKDRSILK